MANQYYWIEALSPLVFRSGKPFGAQSDTEDIVFPLPSSAAGVLRTTWARQQDDFVGKFDSSVLQQIPLKACFLAQQDDAGSLKLFVPKPIDCLYLLSDGENPTNELVRLIPKAMPQNSGCDLPNDGLLPVQMVRERKGKPQSGRSFWLLSDYLDWLDGKELDFETIERNGISLPAPEVRTHVAIDSQTQAGRDSLLFQTAAYDLASAKKLHHQGWENTRLGFVLSTPQVLKKDWVRFGGEGRLSCIQSVGLSDEQVFRLPEVQGNKIKLTLLTPAIFEQGWLPKWLNLSNLTGILPHTNIRVRLCAAAVERWLPVSGWDLATNRPKAMRKAVAAGSVYWFELLDNVPDLNDELKKISYQSVCDDAQDQRDGFGITVVSQWTDE